MNDINPKRPNPFNRHKVQSEHIQHVIERLVERFGIEANESSYFELLELSKASEKLYNLNSNNSVRDVGKFCGKDMWVIFGKSSGELPSRVKTVLYPEMECPVPDSIREFVSRQDFTTQVNIKINDIMEFSRTVVPTVTKKELFTDAKFEHLSRAFITVATKLHAGKIERSGVYRLAVSETIEMYESQQS